MTSSETSGSSHDTASKIKLLIPHLVLAGLCLVFLAFNFWCYHRNNYMRYRQKLEKFIHGQQQTSSQRRVTSMNRNAHIVTTNMPPYDVSSCYGNNNNNNGEEDYHEGQRVESAATTGLGGGIYGSTDETAPPTTSGREKRNHHSSTKSSAEKKERKIEPIQRQVKMPFANFAASASSGKNNRLPAL